MSNHDHRPELDCDSPPPAAASGRAYRLRLFFVGDTLYAASPPRSTEEPDIIDYGYRCVDLHVDVPADLLAADRWSAKVVR